VQMTRGSAAYFFCNSEVGTIRISANLSENRGADTRVCGVETRLDAIPGLFRSWEFR